MALRETRFWKLFEEQVGTNAEREARRLSEQLESSRRRAELIAAEINRDSPNLTQHDISHLDALWEYAETICGASYNLNPAELFVLGISFLIHDLANGVAAIPGGLEEISTDVRWRDVVASEYHSEYGRYPTPGELEDVEPRVRDKAISRYLRETHADYAARIPQIEYKDPATGTPYYLIEDADLRSQYGHLAGRIAASHWWPSKSLRHEFEVKIGARGHMPNTWEVDPLALACVMRCADASHLDSRRAPAFLRAIRKPQEESLPHWVFQDKLQKPRTKDDRLIYTSLSPFTRQEAEAWWLCHDTLTMLHGELSAVDNILSDTGRQRFAVRAVSGISDLEEFSRSIRTEGWHPIDAKIKATDVVTLVRRLGGAELYGNDPTVPIREIISNAADAVRAKKAILSASGVPDWEVTGDVTVAFNEAPDGVWLHVRDTGIGMSKEVLTNALLNFGTSYWDSAHSRRDLPGLLSSGFRPTGQYGIGFFSVFMIGSSVQVISRRHDAAACETLVLEFRDGLTSRPMLRNADAAEQLITGGTEVRVLLNKSVDNILNIGHSDTGKELRTLSEFCAWLCPALDVDLYVVEQAGRRRLVVEADDWKHLSGDRLIERLYVTYEPPVIDHLKTMAGSFEQVLSSDGETIARMTLASQVRETQDEIDEGDHPRMQSWIQFGAPLVVGGVRSGTHFSHAAGLVLGRTVRAARDIAVPIASVQEFSEWATSQGQAWANALPEEDSGRAELISAVAELCGAPTTLPIAKTADGEKTYDELVSFISKRPRIILVHDAAWWNYCYNSPGNNSLGEEVILMYPGRRSLLSAGPAYHGRDSVLFNWGRLQARFAGPNSMAGWVLKAVGEAWGLNESVASSQYEGRDRMLAVVGHKGDKNIRLRALAIFVRSELENL
ncbi:ATP-binding protein [Streptomyces sp. NPDC029041]|uniref:HD domain-containing protein n=1 Tax=Streptomyces sp. NPDC029041 TaxID=3155727 RepID=UPI0033C961E2